MKRNTAVLLTAIGAVLLAGGICTLFINLKGVPALPYILIGVGCGLTGHGIGELLQKRSLHHAPEIQKQIEIEKRDERNVAIANRAKAKAYDLMIFVFGVLLLVFALICVKWEAVLLLAAGYMAVVGYALYYRIKFEKEM